MTAGIPAKIEKQKNPNIPRTRLQMARPEVLDCAGEVDNGGGSFIAIFLSDF
jgi:hypothetical protein